MTKKHFIKIANIIKDSTLEDDKEYMRPIINKMSLISKLCVVFKDDNELFNKDKFVDAC